MITSWQMYWLTRLDSIQSALWAIAIIPVLGTSLWAILRLAGYLIDIGFNGPRDKYEVISRVKVVVICYALSVMTLFVAAFVPSSREMAAIIIVPRIANNEKVQIVGNRLYDLAVEWMDALRPNNNTKGTRK